MEVPGVQVSALLSLTSCLNITPLLPCSKPALLEGLEVDQFIWSVLQTGGCSEADEVQIDSQANVRPVFIKSEAGSGEAGEGGGQVKPISPASMKVPSLGAWDIPTSKSPGLYAPPDMNSKF